MITDPKGDRKRRAHEQDDPDLYVRIVDRNADGIVVRGAKLHITAASLVHELVVMPTKGMRQDEKDYAVSFSIPVNTKGVSIINRSFAPAELNEFDYPASAHHRMPEGFVVFDDVLVPWDRVFLAGEVQLASRLAQSLGLWERTGGVIEAVRRRSCSSASPSSSPSTRARSATRWCMNTIAELITYAEMLRMSLDYACRHFETGALGHGVSQRAGDQRGQILLRRQLPPERASRSARSQRRAGADPADGGRPAPSRGAASTSASTCTPSPTSMSRTACGSTT